VSFGLGGTWGKRGGRTWFWIHGVGGFVCLVGFNFLPLFWWGTWGPFFFGGRFSVLWGVFHSLVWHHCFFCALLGVFGLVFWGGHTVNHHCKGGWSNNFEKKTQNLLHCVLKNQGYLDFGVLGWCSFLDQTKTFSGGSQEKKPQHTKKNTHQRPRTTPHTTHKMLFFIFCGLQKGVLWVFRVQPTGTHPLDVATTFLALLGVVSGCWGGFVWVHNGGLVGFCVSLVSTNHTPCPTSNRVTETPTQQTKTYTVTPPPVVVTRTGLKRVFWATPVNTTDPRTPGFPQPFLGYQKPTFKTLMGFLFSGTTRDVGFVWVFCVSSWGQGFG